MLASLVMTGCCGGRVAPLCKDAGRPRAIRQYMWCSAGLWHRMRGLHGPQPNWESRIPVDCGRRSRDRRLQSLSDPDLVRVWSAQRCETTTNAAHPWKVKRLEVVEVWCICPGTTGWLVFPHKEEVGGLGLSKAHANKGLVSESQIHRERCPEIEGASPNPNGPQGCVKS